MPKKWRNSKVNPKRKKALFSLFLALLLLVSCVQVLPQVTVSLKYFDWTVGEWVEMPSSINSRNYLYGQSFNGAIDGLRIDYDFSEEIGLVNDQNPELGKIYDNYTFDGKTFSLSPVLGNQEPFTGRLMNANTTLYAYYKIERVYEKDLKYLWMLVDRASFIDGTPNPDYSFSGSDISENANLTLLNGIPIMEKEAGFYDVSNDETNTYIPLYKGTTKVVNAPTNLTRHGYKFVGWSRSASSNQVVYPPESSFDLSVMDAYSEDEEITVLYAVWTIDTEDGKYYTLNDFSKGISRFPKYFILNGSETSEQIQDLKSYPNYNEVLLPSKGYTVPLSRSYSRGDNEQYTFEYDFAMAELPITANILNDLNAWNDQYNRGYSLPTPAVGGTKNTELSIVPSSSVREEIAKWEDKATGVNRVFFGSRKADDGTYEAKDGAVGEHYQSSNRTDLVVGISLPQAIVICNALTSYYNYNSDTQFTNRLTPAYTVTIGGKEIKTITEAVRLIEEKKGTNESLSNDIDGVPRTGFRLPSNEEWEYAASVIPQNDWQTTDVYKGEVRDDGTSYKGSSFPQFQKFSQPSGVALTLSSSMSVEESDLLKKYCYYDIQSSMGFSIEKVAGGKEHILSKLSNRSSISGMNGNISEWTGNTSGETLNTDSSLRLFYKRGGSYASSSDGMAIGSVEGVTYKGHSNASLPSLDVNTTVLFDTGFRTVRTVINDR